MDLPEVKGCVGRVWDEHTCGVHHGLSADDHGVRGNPPDSHRIPGRASKRGEQYHTAGGGSNGWICTFTFTWIRQVTVQRMSRSAMWEWDAGEQLDYLQGGGFIAPPPTLCYSFLVWRVPLLGIGDDGMCPL